MTASPRPINRKGCGASVLGGLRLELDVVLESHPRDHVELLLDRVDMLLLVLEDRDEQLAADIVLDRLAMGDRGLELGKRLELEGEVGAKDLLDGLADAQAPEQLEVWQAAEEQDADRQPVGMLHLVYRLVIFELGEPLDAPIVEHAIVEEI